MRLLKEYIPQKLLGIGVLLDYRSVGTVSLSRHNAGGLGDKDHTTGGDVLSTQVLHLADTDAGESDTEDADAIQTNFLSHLEEMLHGTAQARREQR